VKWLYWCFAYKVIPTCESFYYFIKDSWTVVLMVLYSMFFMLVISMTRGLSKQRKNNELWLHGHYISEGLVHINI